MTGCIFCDIVSGKTPCQKVWEDEEHLAFLSIYPNTPGVTVVITKEHLSSNPFSLPDKRRFDARGEAGGETSGECLR